MGTGTTQVGMDRPGVVRGKGRPLNSIDKAHEPRSETVPQYREKADKIRAVIENFAVTNNVIQSKKNYRPQYDSSLTFRYTLILKKMYNIN